MEWIINMSAEHFIGRKNAVKQLQDVLVGKKKSGGNITIQSIEGPGGIGKTCLFDHAFDSVDIKKQNYLILRIDGNSLSTNTVDQAVTTLIDSAKANNPLRNPPRHYFPTVQNISNNIESLRVELSDEIKIKSPENEMNYINYINFAMSAGEKLNELSPKTKSYIDFEKMRSFQPLIHEALPIIESLQEETPSFFERLGIGNSTALRNAIKKDACAELSRAFFSDISAILSGYQNKDFFKASHSKIHGIDKLLLIIDDYEKLQHSFEAILVNHLLSSLRSAEFESFIFIIGRDQLEATNPAWDQHLKKHLMPRIELTPLSMDEMYEFVESYGIDEVGEKERAWRDTHGYPFYVQLWIDEHTSGGRSALMLKRFYDRTTRWMNEQQKNWLKHVLFLNEINIYTLQKMFENKNEASAVFEWFQQEGSIRDTYGSVFRVREYLRSRLIDYLQISDPESCDLLRRKGEISN